MGRRIRKSVDMGLSSTVGIDKQAILEEQLEQSRALRKKNDEAASVLEKNKLTKVQMSLKFLEKDLGILNEIITHFAWEEDVMTSKLSIVNKASPTNASPAPLKKREKRLLNPKGRRESMARRESMTRRGSSLTSKQQSPVHDAQPSSTASSGFVVGDEDEVAVPKRMTMTDAMARVNSQTNLSEKGEGNREVTGVGRKTIAKIHGLGDDAVVVDRLLTAIETRREVASQVSSRVLRNLKYAGFPLEAIVNSTVRHGRLTSGENDEDTVENSIRTSMPLRNRASSAQGRYSVPSIQQCSQEVKNLINMMRIFEGLLKGIYHTRAVREGLWTETMANSLKHDPRKYEERMQWLEKKREEMAFSFEQILKNDARENKGLHDFKALESREAVLEHRLKEHESQKNACAKIQGSVGHLKDTVSMLSGALHQSFMFFDNEISWLSPRISEADKIATTLRETVDCVQSSTESLTKLFQLKGKELLELQKQSTNEDADREILALEKAMWARKMRDLEKVMEKNTRMAKVAASACAMTKEETKAIVAELESSSSKIRLLNVSLDEEQRNVERLYGEFQDLLKELDAESNDCHERERDISSMKSQISIKKVELEGLKAKLLEKGGGMGMKQDIERDLRRMNRKLGEKERDAKSMEAELQHLEQKVFELELVKMEERLERMATQDINAEEFDASSASSSSSESSGGSGGTVGSDIGFGSDVSEARQDAEERGEEGMFEVEERDRMDEERRTMLRKDIEMEAREEDEEGE